MKCRLLLYCVLFILGVTQGRCCSSGSNFTSISFGSWGSVWRQQESRCYRGGAQCCFALRRWHQGGQARHFRAPYWSVGRAVHTFDCHANAPVEPWFQWGTTEARGIKTRTTQQVGLVSVSDVSKMPPLNVKHQFLVISHHGNSRFYHN